MSALLNPVFLILAIGFASLLVGVFLVMFDV